MGRRRGERAPRTGGAISNDHDETFHVMGSRRGDQRAPRMGGAISNGHDDIFLCPSPPTPPKPLLDCLSELERKKVLVRENALSSIIGILNRREGYDSMQEYFATCLYQILGSVKRGSAKEKQLASQVLGLMALTLSDTDYAQEIYQEAVPALTEVLTAKMDSWAVVTILDSLAMVTFFCANNSVMIQATMEIIWEFILPKSKFNVCAKNQVPATLSGAISAWSFLVTIVDGCELTYNHWQGAISHFLKMLESDDDLVCVAAGEALAVIYDRDNLDKFFDEAENLSISCSTASPLKYSEKKKLIKETILKQLEKVSEARSGTSLKQTFCNAARADWDVLRYFKEDKFPQTVERINGQKLALSSWSTMIQLKFLKNFVGEEEFLKHMLENELFHHLFEFKPNYYQNSVPCLYQSTMEKIECNVYLPEERDPELLTRKEKKEEVQWRQSVINKSRTKISNKMRVFAEERKGKGYAIESEL